MVIIVTKSEDILIATNKTEFEEQLTRLIYFLKLPILLTFSVSRKCS